LLGDSSTPALTALHVFGTALLAELPFMCRLRVWPSRGKFVLQTAPHLHPAGRPHTAAPGGRSAAPAHGACPAAGWGAAQRQGHAGLVRLDVCLHLTLDLISACCVIAQWLATGLLHQPLTRGCRQGNPCPLRLYPHPTPPPHPHPHAGRCCTAQLRLVPRSASTC